MGDMDVRLSALSRRQLFGGAAALAVLLLLLIRHLGGDGNAAPAVTPLPAPARAKPAAAKLLVVDVAGAVRRAGLYRLRSGARIDDASAAVRKRPSEPERPTQTSTAATTPLATTDGRTRSASAKPAQSAPTSACGRRRVTSRDHQALQLGHVRRPDSRHAF